MSDWPNVQFMLMPVPLPGAAKMAYVDCPVTGAVPAVVHDMELAVLADIGSSWFRPVPPVILNFLLTSEFGNHLVAMTVAADRLVAGMADTVKVVPLTIAVTVTIV